MGTSACRAALLQAAFLAVCMGSWFSCGALARDDRPNIVLVLTDDQDYMLNSTHPRYMPELDRLVRQRGLEVQHFITSYASCCPSRTSLLTGRHCHNTNMTSNAWPYGGYVKFKMEQLDSQYLPVWLQAAGYDTYYVGKFLNGFTTDSAAVLGCPRGWTDMEGLAQGDTGGGEELYYRDTPVFLRNCRRKGPGGAAGVGAGAAAGAGAGVGAAQLDVERWPDTFLEPVVRQKALAYIDTAAAKGKPFYLQINTFAPHDSEGGSDALPEVEVKYRGLYQDVKLPKSANFGVQVPKQIGYWWPTDVREALPSITARYRARLQALRSVDDTVAALVSRLACRGLLDRTVFIYTSDNGFKLGNHDITQEKFTQYEEDVRLPLVMAGPGIPVGAATGPEFQAAMTDLTATVLWLAGASTGNTTIDGSALPLQDIMTRYAGHTALDGASGDVNTQFCAPAPPPDPPNPPAPPRPPPADSPPPKQPGMLQNLFSWPPGVGIGDSGDDEETPAGMTPSPPASPRLRPPPPWPRTSPQPPLPQPPALLPPPLLRPSPQPPRPNPAAAPSPLSFPPPPVPTTSVVPPPASQPTPASPPAHSPASPPPSPRPPQPFSSGPLPGPPSPTTEMLRLPSQPQPRPPHPHPRPPQPQPWQRPRAWPPSPLPQPANLPPEQQQATPPNRGSTRPTPLIALTPPRSLRSTPKAQPPPHQRPGQRRLVSSSSQHLDRGTERQQWMTTGSATPDGHNADAAQPLTHLLGGWRPEGWSWQHDLWIEEHAAGLGLESWIRDISTAASAAFNTSVEASGSVDAARPGQKAMLAALEGRPLSVLVDGSRLTWYAEERVRVALGEAAAQMEARRQVALQVTPGTGSATEDADAGEQPAGGQRHVLLGTDAASAAAAGGAGAGGGPVPATRLERWSNVALIEAWLDGVFKGKFYKAIRACTTHQAFGANSPWTCYKYTVLCNSVKKQTPVLTNVELYDLGQDPAEVRDRSRLPLAPATKKLIDRLDALLTVLAYCRGDTCRNPFSRIHPDGSVLDLATAMDQKYDSVYAGFQKLQYTQCGIYYKLQNESPDPFLAGRTDQRSP